MEEKRVREILGKINQLSSETKEINSRVLADALEVCEEKIIEELNELHNRGYIIAMPIEGKFKHLRVAQNTEKAEKFLKGESKF